MIPLAREKLLSPVQPMEHRLVRARFPSEVGLLAILMVLRSVPLDRSVVMASVSPVALGVFTTLATLLLPLVVTMDSMPLVARPLMVMPLGLLEVLKSLLSDTEMTSTWSDLLLPVLVLAPRPVTLLSVLSIRLAALLPLLNIPHEQTLVLGVVLGLTP